MSQGQSKSSIINLVFIFFIVTAVLLAGATGRMQAITDESFAAAKSAVTLALGLVGIMALWLGMTRVLEAGGLMYTIAEAGRPLMTRLFPDVPAHHPAMSAMLLNLSANLLGLGNAATPFGIKAMMELNKLNPLKGTATNAMCLFLAINTAHLTLLPLGVIGVRAAAGAARPADIFLPTVIATSCTTLVAVALAFFLARRDGKYRAAVAAASASADAVEAASEDPGDEKRESYAHLRVDPQRSHVAAARLIMLGLLGVLLYRTFRVVVQSPDPLARIRPFVMQELLSFWLMPCLMLLIVAFGIRRGVKVYEAVTEGAKQGFDIALRIIPFLVAILVAIGMFRASGAMELLSGLISPVTAPIGLPAETLPMALIRPLSGSGAFAVMSEIINRAPNSYEAFVVSVIMGCTETTFYVLAVYFGAVGISRVRHALTCGLAADVTGIVAAGLLARLMWAPL